MKKVYISSVLTALLAFSSIFSTNHLIDASNESSLIHDYDLIKRYSSDRNEIKLSENRTESEPPIRYKPKGEKEFSQEKMESIRQRDSTGTELRTFSQHPYHRFDVLIENELKQSDIASFTWHGKTISGRRLAMYGWNWKLKKWIDLAQTIARSNEVELRASVSMNEYVHHKKISVLVQEQLVIPTKRYDYSFVWMSDTQYYAQNYPAVFKSITEWIAQNQAEMKIKYVFHTGDIVHKGKKKKQWQNASTYMNTLDVANIPYGVLPGNHDEGEDFKQFHTYFGQDRFKKKPYYGESYENNRGHYDLITVNGKDYLFLYMGWQVQKKDIEWMNRVLERYSERTAILSFHEYLHHDGKRTRVGNDIFKKVIVPHKNVVAVLSGHYHGSEMLVDELDDNFDGVIDRKVYQLLADYQKAPNGGNGFIRLLHIDEETNSIDVQTYSPYLDEYYYYNPSEYPNKDLFNMDIDVKRTEKMIGTSHFEVNILRKQTNDRVGVRK